MKVIFLDIDGVLNSQNWERYLQENFSPPFYRYDLLEQRAILLLNNLIWETDAKVVLSSSWRIWEPNIDAIETQFAPYRITLYGKTPQLNINKGRGLEIQAWLDEHPEVDKFVIFDDDSDMHHLMPYLVKTTWIDGLQPEHIEKAKELLK